MFLANPYPNSSKARIFALAIIGVFYTHAPAFAQNYYQVSSGTGFFVSKAGHVVTNEHVIRGCDRVQVRGAVSPTQGRVIASDADMDLALIKTDATPPRYAPIRTYGSKLKAGDGLLVMGYPGKHANTGQYKIVESKVIATAGPLGEERWLQFEDSAQKGNSGGPLLDLSGNVVGVISGKAVLTKTNLSNGKEEVVQRSDIAINLPYLTSFLQKNYVNYWQMLTQMDRSKSYIEQTASNYIVNIHCRQ